MAAELPTLYTKQQSVLLYKSSVFVCGRITKATSLTRHSVWGEKVLTPSKKKQLQYSPGGRRGNDVTL